MFALFDVERPKSSSWWRILGGACFSGQPRPCICTDASRGLSVTAEFLVMVKLAVCMSFVTWPVGGIHTFGILISDLRIHYAASMGIQW